jgi:hypothetical protein
MGSLPCPLTLIALSKVDDHHAGLTSSLVSTGQVADGSIGLAIGGNVAWTVVANTARSPANAVRQLTDSTSRSEAPLPIDFASLNCFRELPTS